MKSTSGAANLYFTVRVRDVEVVKVFLVQILATDCKTIRPSAIKKSEIAPSICLMQICLEHP